MTSFRTVLLLSASLVLAAGCGVGAETSDPSLEGEEVGTLNSSVETGPSTAGIVFDDCCVDLTNVVDCRTPGNGICTRFRVSGSRTFYCSATKHTNTCKTFTSYLCYGIGQEKKSSMPCCSGKAAYVGSRLVCK